MRSILKKILNLPWTLEGLILGIFSVPTRISFHRNPDAIVINVRGFWWLRSTSWKRARGMAFGNVVLLASTADFADLHHELIHVEQFERKPFVHPFLNWYQLWRFGYRGDKYEREAYERSGSRYFENGKLTKF